MSDEITTRHTVYGALVASVCRAPTKTAIVYEDRSFSYEEVLWRVDNAALHLLSHGIRKGVAVAAYSQNRPELLFCYYAAAKIGALFVPINPNTTPTEVEYAVRHSGTAVLLHDDAAAENAFAAVGESMAVSLATLMAPMNNNQADVSSAVDPNDDFLAIYTSGTTGTPKAVILDQAAQTRAPFALSEMWSIGDADTTVVALPLGYLYGLSTASSTALLSGGTLVVMRRFHPRDVLEALVNYRASVYHGVPTMFSMMLEYCEQRGLEFDLSHVRELICAGAPLPEETRRRFVAKFVRPLRNYYAMTEATPVFGHYSTDGNSVPDGSVGKAAPDTLVRITRADGSDCDIGEQGEVLVRAAATMKRYLDAPEQTAAAMVGDLVRTGDLGRRDADGYYFITGRIKDIIIRGGANISPSEVEDVLATHPAVQAVAVVGAPDSIFGEVPLAFVVSRNGSEVDENLLIGHAERFLADFKVPRKYMFVTELPLGKTGKIDKALLKARMTDTAFGN